MDKERGREGKAGMKESRYTVGFVEELASIR